MSEVTLQEWVDWANKIKAGNWHTIMLNEFCDRAIKDRKQLEAQLKDRHKRLNKMQKRNADLLEAVEDMDYVKNLRSQLEAVKNCQQYDDIAAGLGELSNIVQQEEGSYMLTSDVLRAIGESDE